MAEERFTQADVEEQVMFPPQVLADMKCLYAGDAPRTPAQVDLQAWQKRDPTGFVKELISLDKAWRASVARLKPLKAAEVVLAPEPEVETDEGSLRVEELIQRLLDEAKKP